MTVPEKKLRFNFFKKLEQIPPTPLNKGDLFCAIPKVLNYNDESKLKQKVPLIKGVTRKSRGIENNDNKTNITEQVIKDRGIENDDNNSNNKLRIYKQKAIDNFIVDFYIPKYKLVIEVDWESHFSDEGKDYDIERTQILEWLWLKVIRYTNKEITENFTWVCEDINKYLRK